MISLKTKGYAHNIDCAYVGTIAETGPSCIKVRGYSVEQESEVEWLDIITTDQERDQSTAQKYISGVPSISHLEVGDILSIEPGGVIRTLFRRASPNNALFVTDRCNSNCLMCSQPPRNKDDLSYYYAINRTLIKQIPTDTVELGITGGEPLLLGKRFVYMLNNIKERLPHTEVHILTNGRAFAWKNIPDAIKEVDNSRMVFGIPLYSDYYAQHDYIVQARNAYTQTLLGLHNMARYGLRAELRIVLHKQTFARLPQMAKFIYHNLPFVEHIAFMGLEYTGYTPYNSNILSVEPSVFQVQLEEAILFLHSVGMTVSIYNLPLCVVRPSLWNFCRASISDWKREYIVECTKCSVKARCGGLFGTSKILSKEIQAVQFV